MWKYGIQSCIFMPFSYHVKLGLLVCFTWYPNSQLQYGLNVVGNHLCIDHSHIFKCIPFISVIYPDPWGMFRYWHTNTYRDQSGCLLCGEPSTHMQEGFIAFCLDGELFLKAPLELANKSLLFVQAESFSYLSLKNNSQIYQQSSICCLSQIHLCLHLLLSTLLFDQNSWCCCFPTHFLWLCSRKICHYLHSITSCVCQPYFMQSNVHCNVVPKADSKCASWSTVLGMTNFVCDCNRGVISHNLNLKMSQSLDIY